MNCRPKADLLQKRSFDRLASCLSAVLATALTAALLTGCSASFQPNPIQTDQTEVGTIQGTVHGGQAPISGAEIYLFAAGTGGYSGGATSLLKAGSKTTKATSGKFANDYYVTTDGGGNFNISGDYQCTQGTQVYLVAYEGNSGSGTSNTYIVQMAGLGECPAAGNLAQTVPYVTINEVSTVVFAYAMGGFGTSATNIGSSGTALAQTGIANAMANVSNILDVGSGQLLTTAKSNSNGVVPYQKIYTLANILASCVNTSGTLGNSGNRQPCYTLLSNTSGTGSDEAQAIFYIVQNPTANVGTLFALQGTGPPFSGLSKAPTDWTIPIVYSNAVSTFAIVGNQTVGGPFNITFDASGNAWIGDRVKGVIEMSPQGAVTTYNHGFGMIKGLAISQDSTSIWAVDYGLNGDNGSLYILDPSGNVSKTITTGLNGPSSIAFDSTGNAYVANETGGSVSVYDSSGNNLDNQTSFGNNIGTPGFIAVDTNNNAWIPSTSTAYIGELTTTVTTKRGVTTTTYAASTTSEAAGYCLVVDGSNNLWFGDYANSQLDERLTKNGKDATNSGGGLNGPYHLSIDGAGNVWVSNEGAALVNAWVPGNGNSGKATAMTTGGFTSGATGGTVAATPDGSGNLWTANTDGTVSQILGLATPTATPIVPGNFGSEP